MDWPLFVVFVLLSAAFFAAMQFTARITQRFFSWLRGKTPGTGIPGLHTGGFDG